MPRKFLKKIMPDHHRIRSHKRLQVFGTLLHDPNLWHLNRRSVAGAFAVGLFMAFVPLPFQMLLAAAVAVLVRVNLPLSVALVWVTNPLTMPPMFFAAYKLGAWLMGERVQHVQFEPSVAWLMGEVGATWQPFLLGCFVAGAVSALIGYVTIRLLWRWHIVRAHHQRRRRDAARGRAAPGVRPHR